MQREMYVITRNGSRRYCIKKISLFIFLPCQLALQTQMSVIND